jgi:SAM-dependent methyltransferase
VADPNHEREFSSLERFDHVDETDAADMFVAFLRHVDSLPDVVRRRNRTYELLRLPPGARVADVGCGIGTAVKGLAEAGFDAVGFDASEQMVGRARRLVEGARFEVADATALPVPDGSLDGYRSERVYQHLPDPAAALEEARRVLRPGGRIVLVDQDWDAFVVDADDLELTRAIMLAFSDSLVNGRIGRRHRSLLVDAGFEEVGVEPETVPIDDFDYLAPVLPTLAETARAAGEATEAQTAEWLDEQRRRGAEGRFFAAMTHFVTSGTRPA